MELGLLTKNQRRAVADKDLPVVQVPEKNWLWYQSLVAQSVELTTVSAKQGVAVKNPVNG